MLLPIDPGVFLSTGGRIQIVLKEVWDVLNGDGY